MSNQPDNKTMSNIELARDVQLMANSITQLSENISKLVESDIRRQERESRQQEFNEMARDRLHQLEDWKREIEISRAKESQGREILMKYWWVLLIVGGFVVYKLTKTNLIALLG